MASVFAIISKAQFEQLPGVREVGWLLAIDRYTSTHRSLDVLADGGDLYMVTVRPGDTLWLVGVLRGPEKGEDAWTAAPNKVAITDITALIPQLKFGSGNGITREPGKLGMSLQTPKALTEADLAHLRGALDGQPAVEAPAVAPPAPAPPEAKKKPAARKPKAAPPAPEPVKAEAKSDWLSTADSALRGGKAKVALTVLLSAWRDLRHPALAETIERVSELVTRDAPPIAGKKLGEKLEDWAARAKAADPADFGVLAQNLFLRNGGSEVGEKLEQLAQWPADPRFATLCHELALKVPFTASSAKPFWRSLFTVLPKAGDPRTAAALDAADANFATVFSDRADYMPYLTNQTRKVREALEHAKAHPLDDSALATLAAMRSFVTDKARPSRGDVQVTSLLEAVFLDPTNDAPREVLADALMEAGDPRGEFITQQLATARGKELTRDEKRHERSLLEDHAEAWLGPLAGWTRKGDREWRRGFLSKCTIEPRGRSVGPFPEVDDWGTVEEATAVGSLTLEALRRMRGARRLLNVDYAALFAMTEPMPLLAEVLARGRYAPDLFATWRDSTAFPGLRRLRLDTFGSHVNGLPGAAEVVALFGRLPQVRWLRAEVDVPDRSRNDYGELDLALERTDDGLVLHLTLPPPRAQRAPWLAGLRLVAEAVRGLDVRRTVVRVWEHQHPSNKGKKPAELLGPQLPRDEVFGTGLPSPEVHYELLSREGVEELRGSI